MELLAIALVLVAFLAVAWLAWRYRTGKTWYKVQPERSRFVSDNVYELLVQIQHTAGNAVWVQSWVQINAKEYESYDSFGIPVWIRGTATDGVEVLVAYEP